MAPGYYQLWHNFGGKSKYHYSIMYERVLQQLIEVRGRDPLFRPQVVFCCDYETVLNQNLVQDVQGLSSQKRSENSRSQKLFYQFGWATGGTEPR